MTKRRNKKLQIEGFDRAGVTSHDIAFVNDLIK